MSYAEPFALPGNWYKGALHVHTTRSDGRLSPAATLELYSQHGYHFLAVTDHDVITDLSAQNHEGFLNIPAVEVSYDSNGVGQSYHLVVVGVRQMISLPASTPIQQAIGRWAETGAVIFLAHPYWSGMVLPEILSLQKLMGLEIFNNSCQTDLGKGLATVHWDDLLARGKHWLGFAVDDTHAINNDALGGWIWVKSERLDEEAILRALKAGAFYASSGPDIRDFRVENGVAWVRCSPVTAINFIGHTQWGAQRRAAPGGTLTEAEYRFKGPEVYVRAECVDDQGHTAWTNPVFLR